jgi:hypothetical protein
MHAGFEPYPKFKCVCGLAGGLTVGVIPLAWFKRTNHLFSQPLVACAIHPGAEAVRGWRRLNHPMVCTIGAVAFGARFLCFKERVSQVHSRGSVNCRTKDNKLEEGDFQEA